MISRVLNVGLVRRALAEILPSTLLLASLAGGLSYLFGYVFPRIQERIMNRGGPTAAMLRFRQQFLGDDAAMAVPAQIAAGIHWSHPVLLALVFAQIIVVCTRVPAGETERGTIDLLMGLPVTRWQVYIAETIACTLGALLVLLAAGTGAYLARSTVKPEFLAAWPGVLRVLLNLACLQMAVIGVVMLLSTMCERRGRAVLAGVAIILAWIVLEFLGGLWDPAKKIEWLSAIHYYKPLSVMQTKAPPDAMWLTTLPLTHMAILLGIGLIAWIGGGVILNRRPLTSV
jgi:ABC-type transport system involved in multi-copper enzyme maturation permease subunit